VAARVEAGAPQSEAVGQVDPGAKVPTDLFYFQEIQKNTTTCKMHIYLSVGQKNVYDLSNCSEKHALHFCIKIMHA
jgi:hypothetical protein